MERLTARLSTLILLTIHVSLNGVAAGEWRSGPHLNVARRGASAVTVDGQVYLLGGTTFSNSVLNSVELLDPEDAAWDTTAVPRFTIPRYNAAAVVQGERIFLIGGKNHNGAVTGAVETFSGITGNWTTSASLNQPRTGHVAVILNERIVVVAGENQQQKLLSSIEWYDETEDTWVYAASSFDHVRSSPYFGVYRDSLYLFGGIALVPIQSSYLGFTVDEDWTFSWRALEPVGMLRGYGSSGHLGNRIFLIGGNTFTGATTRVERFHIKTGEMSKEAPLNYARMGAAAATMEGNIYVMGGALENFDLPLSTTEIYSEEVISADIADDAYAPQGFASISGFPNPFNGRTQLQIEIPFFSSGERLDIVDLLGRHVRTISNTSLRPGRHHFTWNGQDSAGREVASGLYFAVLQSQSYLKTVKLLYTR